MLCSPKIKFVCAELLDKERHSVPLEMPTIIQIAVFWCKNHIGSYFESSQVRRRSVFARTTHLDRKMKSQRAEVDRQCEKRKARSVERQEGKKRKEKRPNVGRICRYTSKMVASAPSLILKPGKFGRKSLPIKTIIKIKSSMIRSRSNANRSVAFKGSKSTSRYSRRRQR